MGDMVNRANKGALSSIDRDEELKAHLKALERAAHDDWRGPLSLVPILDDDMAVYYHDAHKVDDALGYAHPTKSTPPQVTVGDNLKLALEQGKVTEADMVNLPPHYARFKFEPMRIAVENGLDALEFNAVKYLLRAPFKGQTQQDYDKAIRCIVMKKKQMAGDPDWWTREIPGATI
jgi:hypothetical protein